MRQLRPVLFLALLLLLPGGQLVANAGFSTPTPTLATAAQLREAGVNPTSFESKLSQRLAQQENLQRIAAEAAAEAKAAESSAALHQARQESLQRIAAAKAAAEAAAKAAADKAAADKAAADKAAAAKAAAKAAAPKAAPAPSSAYSFNVYTSAGWVKQGWHMCVSASVQMMLNWINGGANHDLGYQAEILAYGQQFDDYGDRADIGTDVLGWSAALNHFGGGAYSPVSFSSATSALHYAAQQMALTHRPVGLLMIAGGHAEVMTGFTASANPASGSFNVTGVYYSNPYANSPNNHYSAGGKALANFTRNKDKDTSDKSMLGLYWIVAPQ